MAFPTLFLGVGSCIVAGFGSLSAVGSCKRSVQQGDGGAGVVILSLADGKW